ncbi:MAG: TonB-dependent receptor plug domain-containing protein, partial [Acidobacteriia bacterium]|nr:TonB-dependent receptor plug domain-containing protein [Terriglobia bacterium]
SDLITASERLPAGEIVLPIGDVTEHVTVEAAGTPVQTDSGERSGVLTPAQMATQMSRGRDFLYLLRVLPGVVPPNDSDVLGQRTALPNIQGMRSTYSNISMDGISTNDLGSMQVVAAPVNLDAIGEVKVLMTNYQAEYGRSGGPVVNVVTKSGTRDFHGSAYYYKRNEEFNANSFFNNRNGLPIARYRYNTWGYNIGGPAYIPKLLARDKLFFFFSQEILPTQTPQNIQSVTVPTAAERAGDFSADSVTIRDPLNNTPFAGNRIPSNRIDPNGQKLLSIFPLPNQLNTAITRGTYNYSFQESIPATRYNEVYRTDYNVTDKLKMYIRGSDFRLHQEGYNIPGGASGAAWGELLTYNDYKDDSGVFNAIYTPSATMVNEGSFSVHHDQQIAAPLNQAAINKASKAALGINLPQFCPQCNPLNLIPFATFGGVLNAASFSTDTRFPTRSADTVFDVTDNLTKIWGNHTLKAGIFAERVRYFSSANGTYAGSFDFSSDTNNPLNTGYAYSNAILGVYRSYTESTSRVETNGRGTTLEWFLQDSWKANRKLTLDYGIRFTYYTPYNDARGQAASFIPPLYNPSQAPRLYYPAFNAARQRVGYDPVTGTVVPAALIGYFVPNSGNTANGMVVDNASGVPGGLMSQQGILYAPRFGFAYDVFGDGKTAIRGGFGIFYNARERVLLLDVAKDPPIQYNPTLYYGTLNTLGQNAGYINPSSTAGLDPTGKVPNVYNFSFGIQRSLGWNTVMDVAYVGAVGRHLLDERNLNTLPYGKRFQSSSIDPTTNRPLSDQFLEPYPGYTTIQLDEFASTSNYNSLQVQVNRRFSHGLQFGGTWTWSKSMDYVSNDFALIADIISPRVWNYGKSDFDRTHIAQINWLWDIPDATKLINNRVVGAIANHWQLSGVASFVSGAPTGITLTTTNGADLVGGGDGVRVNVIANPILSKDQRTFYRYFNTAAFAEPTGGYYGNAPRDVIRGPGINNFDMSIFKNIPVKEKAQFQLRFEAYNAFNHTQFSSVNTTAQFNPAGQQVNAAFGQITAARSPRVGQASVRFTF